ncbi:zinc-dependent metalloprotease [Mycobacterium sp. NBC_00419]|uniref:zinc-dependent metalloprotease n=1 Tax=Mycobacterium sp. NBC_00419 TaxID=2975989 RepID=UPI002E21A948
MSKTPDDLTVGRAVDWQFAGTVGAWLTRPGPPATDYTRRQAIDELASASRAAEGPVRDVTHLGTDAAVPDARIVDREQWIRAAADSMRVMTGGTDKAANPITGRITGAQTGAVLAFVSSGILGQFDPFAVGAQAGGQLLLVYPNVIAVERQLRVSPSDFRLWVCLHEVTHRVQFNANPWLAQHMSRALGVLTSDAGDDVATVVARLAEFVKDRRSGSKPPDPNSEGILGFMRAVQSEPQRQAMDQLLVLGTLLEGHADHVMDAVGPAVVPSVHTIRNRFDQRRQRHQPPLQRLLRALLGLDAKMSQYTRGKAFVDHVVTKVGMDRFNTVWSGPDTLPLPDEIEDPQRWIDRVL